MRQFLLLLSILPIACASSDDRAATPPTNEKVSQGSGQEVFMLRVDQPREARAQARFTGQYEIVNGCLAFRGEEQLYLPAMGASAQVSLSENEVNFGNRVIELGVDTLIVGGVFQGDLAALSSSLPPPECRWPVII